MSAHAGTHNSNKENTHRLACTHKHIRMAKKETEKKERKKRLTIQVLGKLRFKHHSAGRNRRAVIGSQRENSRFVQQRTYYWSKYCLKRSVLRLDLKAGREGLCQTAKGREFHTWAAEKQKAQPPCCFLSKVSMQTILSSEEECILRRDIDLDKVNQVLRSNTSDGLIAETSYFVFNSLFYWEPVQLLEKIFGMLYSTRFKDNLSWPHTAETMTLLGTWLLDKRTEQLVMVAYCWNKQWLSWGTWSSTRGQSNLSWSHSNSLSTISLNVTMTFWVEMKSSDKWTGYNNLSCSHSNGLLTLSLSDLLCGDEVIRQVDRV